MKKKYTGIMLVLFVLLATPAHAQKSLFKPFTAFRVIQTERFDIIFPKESESSARLLASYADNVYEQVSSLLGIEYPGRIPVTFTPYTDEFNGYYSRFPSSHIMLFDTPMDLEWTNFANNLEGLFLHELTHAVSLNTRSPFYRFLHHLFGSWVMPAWVSAPGFMVEGVTVSFESLTGFGRADDPLIKQKLRQAIHEDTFLTPFQASGAYDFPGQESMIYEYGGPFSAWLQRQYGMEKYAELWQAMGRIPPYSFSIYRSGYYRVFKNIYDIDFLDAWNAFSASLAVNGLETNPDEILPVEHRFFSEKANFIRGLSAGGNSLYFIDGLNGKIRVYDTHTGKTRSLNGDSYSVYDLDVATNGTVLLLSGYRYIENRAVAVVTEHKTDSGRSTGRNIQGLYKARYFRDGVIGIRSQLHNNCIVYEDFNGNSDILFRGNEALLFSGPQPVDDERIVFIAARDGIRELWLYNYISRELFRIETLSGNNTYWLYMRNLGVSEGKLFFSHNANDRMYKLASIDLETMQAEFSGQDFSGGVFNPVSLDGAVYYRGSFFSHDSLLRFPESSLGTRDDIKLVKLDSNNYEIIADSEFAGIEPASLEPLYSGASRPYFSLRYMSPFQYWLPLPLIRDGISGDLGIRLDGGGLLSLIADPADRNLITILAYADIHYRMAMIEQFSWRNTSLGFPLEAAFSDTVTESANDVYRYTSSSLAGSFYWTIDRWVPSFSLGGSYIRIADDDGGESAYQWEKASNYFLLYAGLGLSNRRHQAYEIFGTGLSLNIRGVSIINDFEPRVDGIFQASAETRFPIRLTIFGAYDNWGMDLHGKSRIYGERAVTEFALTEYPHPNGLNLNWLAGGEAALGLFSFEIQKNLSHLYINRFFGVLSLNNLIYDGKDHPGAEGIAMDNLRLLQSLRLKLAMKMSGFFIVKTLLSVEPYVLGAWKFSNVITNDGADQSFWFLSMGIKTSF